MDRSVNASKRGNLALQGHASAKHGLSEHFAHSGERPTLDMRRELPRAERAPWSLG